MKKAQNQALQNKKGFTLIEMIVVMAIILMLSLLLYSAVVKGIEKGQQAQCIGHLKQIGLAFQMYINDSNSLPYAKRYAYSDDPESIISCLSSYLDNAGTYICKSTEKPFKNQYRLSYVYNISGDVIDFTNLIGRPAKSIATGNWTETWLLVDARSPGNPNPHLDFADSLWLDGHVEATRAD